ncbi:alkaline phytoceramidase [Pochonia chlamydosporia 170]|uniref:Alkaline phytoceramidase n=1 Tax=Pochonia chlamydosporia 170 TaxID=1380566 RepID=A0A179FEW8_METCM|nr:alkaline phytoceramidase [Pochonia chlamydosporia 170]OAQ64145.1 alkaline phytoceramidase [Pochonia chlamydosporia 170]
MAHGPCIDPMQLLDELGMIYTTCLMMYASFAFSRSRIFAFSLGVGLTALAAFITVSSAILFARNAAYAALTATVLFRSIWVMEVQLRPALEAEDAERARYILKTMWALVATGEIKRKGKGESCSCMLGLTPNAGLTIFLAGFAIWNLDNIFCTTLRGWRREIGLPWAILLEGHGWWHLMTGLGTGSDLPILRPDADTFCLGGNLAYYYLVWGIWLRRCLEGQGQEYDLYWPRVLLSIPEIRKEQRKAKDH